MIGGGSTIWGSAHLAREKMLDSFCEAAPEPERSPAQAEELSLVRLLDLNKPCQIKSELLRFIDTLTAFTL